MWRYHVKDNNIVIYGRRINEKNCLFTSSLYRALQFSLFLPRPSYQCPRVFTSGHHDIDCHHQRDSGNVSKPKAVSVVSSCTMDHSGRFIRSHDLGHSLPLVIDSL